MSALKPTPPCGSSLSNQTLDLYGRTSPKKPHAKALRAGSDRLRGARSSGFAGRQGCNNAAHGDAALPRLERFHDPFWNYKVGTETLRLCGPTPRTRAPRRTRNTPVLPQSITPFARIRRRVRERRHNKCLASASSVCHRGGLPAQEYRLRLKRVPSLP